MSEPAPNSRATRSKIVTSKTVMSKAVLITAAGALMLCGCQNPFVQPNSSLADRDEPSRHDRPAGSTSLEDGRGDQEHRRDDRPEDVAERFANGRRPALSRDGRSGSYGTEPYRSEPGRSDVRAMLEDGHQALARGQVEQARSLYEQVLAEQPQHAEAHHRLAILADRDGHYAAAEHHYLAALRGKPDDANLLSDLGYSYFLQGRPGESEHFLQAALRHDPQHPHARENLELLRDPVRAASVLRELQGPQAETTLARLFSMGSSTPTLPVGSDPRYATARPGYGRDVESMANRNPAAFDERLDQPPPGVDPNQWLWEKMQAARTESIAQRPPQPQPPQPQPPRQWPQQRPEWPVESHPNYPPAYPGAPGDPRASRQRSEYTAAHIRSALEAIDRGADPPVQPRDWRADNRPVRQAVAWDAATPAASPYPSQTPPQQQPAVIIEPRRLATGRPTDQSVERPTEMPATNQPPRAASPQWDSVPQNWPEVPITASSPNPQPSQAVPSASSMSYEEAARRAAELGMQTGPGAIFPSLSAPPTASHHPSPTPRELPGTATHADASWPHGGSAVETRYDHRGPIRQIAAEQPVIEPRANDPRTIDPSAHPLDEYEQMRRQHAAEFNGDLRRMAEQRGHWDGGPPARPPLPTSFDPRQRPWPEYGPDDQNLQNLQFQSRQVDPPAYPRHPAQYGSQPDYTGGIAHDYGTGAAPSYDPGYGAGYGTAPPRSRY